MAPKQTSRMVKTWHVAEEIQKANEGGWTVTGISTGGSEWTILLLTKEPEKPTPALSGKALAYLATSPDPDVAAEATALIVDAVGSDA